MTSIAICFGLLVLACFVWLNRDNTHWKEMKEKLSEYYIKSNEHLKISKEANESASTLRQTVLGYKMLADSYKNENQNLQDHVHRLQQSVLLLDNKIKILSDQVHGFSIKMPESISITLTKDVKSAATSRNNHKKSDGIVKNSKVQRPKMATKTARRS